MNSAAPTSLTLEQVSPLLVETLAAGANVRMVVRGRSMRPFVFDGEQVELAACGAGMPRRGRIVLVRRSDGSWVLHRVTRAAAAGFSLRGDAQAFEEGPLAPEQAVAIAVAVIRGGRVVPLDRGYQRWAGVLWHAALPLRPALLLPYRLTRRLLAGTSVKSSCRATRRSLP